MGRHSRGTILVRPLIRMGLRPRISSTTWKMFISFTAGDQLFRHRPSRRVNVNAVTSNTNNVCRIMRW